jgi:hypothetical protein
MDLNYWDMGRVSCAESVSSLTERSADRVEIESTEDKFEEVEHKSRNGAGELSSAAIPSPRPSKENEWSVGACCCRAQRGSCCSCASSVRPVAGAAKRLH